MIKDLRVEYRSVGELKPYQRNARTHSPEQIDKIVRSIREFGWTNPILVDGANGVIAGHGRLLAAHKLDMATVPVIELDGLSEAQKRAYILADNRTALDAGWDNDLLRIELGELKSLDFNLELTGFSLEELGGLLTDQTLGLTDPDDAPEPPASPVAAVRDVWLLGSHRLVCGDSTEAEAVEAALNGVKPHLLVSDPPYGVSYDPDWRNKAAIQGTTAGRKRGVIGGSAIGTVPPVGPYSSMMLL